MEAMENILTRRSVRVYKDQPVSRETLDTVLAAAQMAPTWKNTQTPGYIVITTPEKKSGTDGGAARLQCTEYFHRAGGGGNDHEEKALRL